MKYGLFYIFLYNSSAYWPYLSLSRLSLINKGCSISSDLIPFKNLLIVAPSLCT